MSPENPRLKPLQPWLNDHLEANPDLKRLVQDRLYAMDIAQWIYDQRTAQGLTQSQLAKLAETTQPVISRLEAADYRGHSLPLLFRIAEALDQRLELRFVPKESKPEKQVSGAKARKVG